MLVFSNSLFGGFVYDDRPIIVENPLVRGRATISQMLASGYWDRGENNSSGGGLYRPLTIWTLAQNWRMGGGSAFIFHLFNLIIHAAASVLVLFLLWRFGLSLPSSVAGALAFAVLPVHVEAVAWTVGRAEALGALFFFAAWLLLHQSSAPNKILAGLFCYMLALLSKESSATLPAALVLGEIYARRGSLKSLVEKRLPVWIAAFGTLAAYLYWRRCILGSALKTGALYFLNTSKIVAILTMAKFFFRGWLVPIATGLGLCADYNRPAFADSSASDMTAWAALALIIAGLVFALRDFVRKKSFWSFAVLLFAALAIPMSNTIVPMGILGADRFEYLPSVAFCFLFALGWERLKKYRAGFAAMILLWSALTVSRNRVWASDETLFSSLAQTAPDNVRVLNGEGISAGRAGRQAEAREYFRRALAADPVQTEAAYNIGKSLFDEGDWRGAKPWFSKLGDKDSLCYLGMIAEREGNLSAAKDYYLRTLEKDPTHPEALYNLGLLNSARRRNP